MRTQRDLWDRLLGPRVSAAAFAVFVAVCTVCAAFAVVFHVCAAAVANVAGPLGAFGDPSGAFSLCCCCLVLFVMLFELLTSTFVVCAASLLFSCFVCCCFCGCFLGRRQLNPTLAAEIVKNNFTTDETLF